MNEDHLDIPDNAGCRRWWVQWRLTKASPIDACVEDPCVWLVGSSDANAKDWPFSLVLPQTISAFDRASFPSYPWPESYDSATFVLMIRIGDVLLSEDVFERHFMCDLSACKGACCVEGESGAPLTQTEVGQLEKSWEHVAPLLPESGMKAVEEQGFAVTDSDGDLVTPLVNGKECAFTVFDEQGIAKCGLEQAYLNGKTDWRKPLSCHLYPIRAKQLIDFVALNVHHWPICDAARICGSANQVTVLDFCKDSLVRKFGEAWYTEAQEAQTAWQDQTNR